MSKLNELVGKQADTLMKTLIEANYDAALAKIVPGKESGEYIATVAVTLVPDGSKLFDKDGEV